MAILKNVKIYLKETVAPCNDIYKLVEHVPEVEKWALKILPNYQQADKEIVLLAVWLHDISYYIGDKEADHAEKSEKMARKFLEKEGLEKVKIEKVAHCIRAHRNRDVAPQSIEAKIVACADSASHMTWITYTDMLNRNPIEKIFAKLDRDYRDIGLLPEVQKQLTPLYMIWKKVLEEIKKLEIL